MSECCCVELKQEIAELNERITDLECYNEQLKDVVNDTIKVLTMKNVYNPEYSSMFDIPELVDSLKEGVDEN